MKSIEICILLICLLLLTNLGCKTEELSDNDKTIECDKEQNFEEEQEAQIKVRVDEIYNDNYNTEKEPFDESEIKTDGLVIKENLVREVKYIKKYNDTKMEGFVVGGDYGYIDSYPHAVYLYVKGMLGSWICGASILNQRLLLTAAHCVNSDETIQIEAYAGDANLNRIKVIRYIQRYIIHADYDSHTVANDIALLMLRDSFPLGQHIRRVIIRRSFPAQSQGHVAGWGVLDDDLKTDTVQMMTVIQKLWPTEYCTRQVALRPGMICASRGVPHVHPAEGDSGSAFILDNYQQIGIVSFRGKYNHDVVVYSNVSYFYNWITNKSKLLMC